MNLMLVFLFLFIFFTTLSYFFQIFLNIIQIRYVLQHRNTVPAAFTKKISLQAHQKAADYVVAKEKLAIVQTSWATVMLLVWTLWGGLGYLFSYLDDHFFQAWGFGSLSSQVILFVVFMCIGGALDLPFSLYRTFVVEQHYGFNQTTWQLWLSDWIKGLLLGAVIALPLLASVLWLMQQMGAWWWLYAWGLLMAFQLAMLWIFPTWIAPLFNKFTPLPDGELKTKIETLLQRCGFHVQGLFVVDGSKRSTHANAYFTGLGRSKRVVFYDTLLAKLGTEEIEAVLAHELGHFRRHHIPQRIAVTSVLTLGGFALLGWIAEQSWFYAALGVAPVPWGQHQALALILFALAVPVFTYFLSPITAMLSRKHEFEADAFASQHASAQHLAQALLTMYEDNASTLTPHPLYTRFYYSHPPASERLARLEL